jgi:hypothetical protein
MVFETEIGRLASWVFNMLFVVRLVHRIAHAQQNRQGHEPRVIYDGQVMAENKQWAGT